MGNVPPPFIRCIVLCVHGSEESVDQLGFFKARTGQQLGFFNLIFYVFFFFNS